MPIILDDLQNSAVVTKYTCKFFDKKLTGTGGNIGLLNKSQNPMYIPIDTSRNHNMPHGAGSTMKKSKYVNNGVEVTKLPFCIIPGNAWSYAETTKTPDIKHLHKVATADNGDSNVYINMSAHGFVLEESRDATSGSIIKDLTISYRADLYIIYDETDPVTNIDTVNYTSMYSSNTPPKGTNVVDMYFSCNPKVWFEDELTRLSNNGYTVDKDALETYIKDYSLYDAILNESIIWQTTIDTVLDDYFTDIASRPYTANILNVISDMLRNIEDYNVPLELYRNIYASIVKNFKADEVAVLCKQNLNLLLSDTLHKLDMAKPNLTSIPNIPNKSTRFSAEQKKAIATTGPLTMVQAGAGTGKSTVVLGRIAHMVDAGVNPEDITVLSFTNAAADNITARNPRVKSMTIARMIHTIYSANFPHHALSSLDTIINSLDIYFPNDDFAKSFQHRLRNIGKNERDAFTQANIFIENNYDKVMEYLDTIRQTSLELEIIVCYQKIDTLIEPPTIKSRYLIIDEVQDTSIFEFIYILKYVNKHQESLFIVGDSAQTLYEFRSANPRALNVLEGSGVFDTFQLQINFRSNQEILDFANIALSNIEANQYANIQLQANSLDPVTAKSFSEKVRLQYVRLNKQAEFEEILPELMKNNIKPYVDSRLNKDEQIAFLAFTRRQVLQMETLLKEMYPNKKILNLVPEKLYNSTVFSAFIKKYWSQVNFMPLNNIMGVIDQEIMGRLKTLVLNPSQSMAPVRRLIDQWKVENQSLVHSWHVQYVNGMMPLATFLENIKENMLSFEIRNNAIRQSLLSMKNEANKNSNDINDADILLSTIHSAKGLEFENVVLLYRNQNTMPEDAKRMYYVAFTRAINTEYILTYDTVASPKIQGDYEIILNKLSSQNIPSVTA